MGRGCDALASGLAGRGFDVHVVGEFYSGLDLELNGFTLHQVGTSRLSAVDVLPFWLRRLAPDVLITWLPWTSACRVPSILRRFPGTPFVQYQPIESNSVPPRLLEYALAGQSILVACTEHMQGLLRSGGVECGYVPHGCRTDIFYPRREEKSPFTVLFVGMNERRKMLDLLLSAFDEFALDKPEVRLDLHTTVAPVDPTSWGYDLNHLLPRYGLAGKVVVSRPTMLDSLSDPGLAGLYNRASVFATASASEGFDFCVLEAMACGVPCVASDIPPHRELLGGGGELVRCPHSITAGFGEELALIDPKDMAEKLERLYEDPGLLKKYSGAGRASAEKYDWRRVIGRWVRLLEDLEAERCVGPPPPSDELKRLARRVTVHPNLTL